MANDRASDGGDAPTVTPAGPAARSGGRAKGTTGAPRAPRRGKRSGSYGEGVGLVGEGSFGCVFTPPVRCVGAKKGLRRGASPPEAPASRQRATDQVGKVFFDRDDYLKELRTSREIAQIDASGDRLLLPTARCETTRAAVLAHPAGYLCEKHSENPQMSLSQELYQLVMPNGGPRLDHYASDAAAGGESGREVGLTPKQLLALMMPVLEGVAALVASGKCHQDIKTSNILVAPVREGSPYAPMLAEHRLGEAARLIDYSLTIALADVYAAVNRRRWRFSYFPYPPEYKMFNYIYQAIRSGTGAGGATSSIKITTLDHDKEAVLSEVKKNWMSFGERRAKAYYKLFGAANIREAVGETFAWAVEASGAEGAEGAVAARKSRAKLQKAFAPFAEKLDVYSVGMVLIDITRHASLAGYPHGGRWMRAYREFLRAMAHPDPRRRLTAAEALARARELMELPVRAARAAKPAAS